MHDFLSATSPASPLQGS